MKTYYSNFEELNKDNPEAVSNGYDYLERPDNGWIETSYGFIGIGYHGNEGVYFKEKWYADKAGKGHIPTNGYG